MKEKKISKNALFKALKEEGEFYGSENPFKPFYGCVYKPKVVLIVEKYSIFEVLEEEFKKRKIQDICVISINGYPADIITTESIKRIITPKTKIYYLGDLDPVSFSAYYCLKKGHSKFTKNKDKLKIKFIGILAEDVKKYSIFEKWSISLGNYEKTILRFLMQNKLVPELKKHAAFLGKGKKYEIECLYLALKNKHKTFYDYFKGKKII